MKYLKIFESFGITNNRLESIISELEEMIDDHLPYLLDDGYRILPSFINDRRTHCFIKIFKPGFFFKISKIEDSVSQFLILLADKYPYLLLTLHCNNPLSSYYIEAADFIDGNFSEDGLNIIAFWIDIFFDMDTMIKYKENYTKL